MVNLIQAGKTTLDPEQFKGKTFEQFKEKYRGLIDSDLATVWEKIEKVNKTNMLHTCLDTPGPETTCENIAIIEANITNVRATTKLSKKRSGAKS